MRAWLGQSHGRVSVLLLVSVSSARLSQRSRILPRPSFPDCAPLRLQSPYPLHRASLHPPLLPLCVIPHPLPLPSFLPSPSLGPASPRHPFLRLPPRVGGVAGYRICLTHRRSSVRSWVDSVFCGRARSPRPTQPERLPLSHCSFSLHRHHPAVSASLAHSSLVCIDLHRLAWP